MVPSPVSSSILLFSSWYKPALLTAGIVVGLQQAAHAQTIAGRVFDVAGQPIPGVTVVLPTVPRTTITDSRGHFEVTNLPTGTIALRFSAVGFVTYETTSTLEGPQARTDIFVQLKSAVLPLAEAQIVATRANAQTATAYTDLDQQALRERNFSQDIPYLLDQTPSVVTTSDAGTGIGYTGLRIRGTDPTRVNVTLNGVPVNEAESHSVFFVDLPDLASSTQSIQVQRGVGTSTNGAGAFGGSVNIQTTAPRPRAYAELTNAAGSFGTWRTTIGAGTGLLGNDSTKGRFALDARASRVQSEGFIDRGFSRLRSLYLAGTYTTDKTLVRAMVLTGHERTGQAWYGVPQDSIKKGVRTYNPAGFDYDDYAGNQRAKPYPNQVDDYQQDYYQLLVSHQFTPAFNVSVTPFWTRGGGYYEQFKAQRKFGEYGIGPDQLIVNNDTITRTDVVQRRWLRTSLFGATWAATLAPTEATWSLTLGGAAVGYRGQNYDEVIWAQYFPLNDNYHRYSDETSSKRDLNAYLRGTWRPVEALTAFVDLQYRAVSYSLLAPTVDGNKQQQTFNFGFFNPKAGLTYGVAENVDLYASVAVAQREPTRTAYQDTPPSRRPTSEHLTDYEAGIRRTFGRWQWGVNGYWMQYRDQLVLSGKLDDVGNPIPTNVKDSYRRGVEVMTAASFLNDRLRASGNVTFSQNRVKNYVDYVFDYDTYSERATAYNSTTIAYSPSVIGAVTLEAEVVKGLRVALLGKHVGRQYLDNTATAARALDPYTVVDARLRYLRPVRFAGLREVEAAVLVANVLSEQYESNGYTYGWYSEGARVDFNYLYPQAPRNLLATVSLRW